MDYTSQTYEQIINHLSQGHAGMRRRVVGFISSGNFMQSESREGGIGYVYEDVHENEDIFSNSSINVNGRQCTYILIRKPSSRYYFVGVMSRL